MRRIIMLLVFVLLIIFLFPVEQKNKEYSISGFTMGKIPYNIKYISKEVLLNKNEIDSILISFNNIFSTYIPSSEISVINRSSGKVNISDDFSFLLDQSKSVYKLTDGYFDPTIGPIVNLWGFGPEKLTNNPKKSEVNNLLQYVGLNKIKSGDNFLIKNKNTYIDFSSIAKGYAVDLLYNFLIEKNIFNFFLDIGGEIRANGNNIKNRNWVVGIENPFEIDSNIPIATASLDNLSIATSGNYRNFYKIGDSLIFHTIDPKTGYPSKTNMLSASVFSETCFLADAYATSFMVMGFEKSKKLSSSIDEIEVLLIYYDNNGEIKKYLSDGIKDKINLIN